MFGVTKNITDSRTEKPLQSSCLVFNACKHKTLEVQTCLQHYAHMSDKSLKLMKFSAMSGLVFTESCKWENQGSTIKNTFLSVSLIKTI
jgi:hypothetical protein